MNIFKALKNVCKNLSDCHTTFDLSYSFYGGVDLMAISHRYPDDGNCKVQHIEISGSRNDYRKAIRLLKISRDKRRKQ
jgi:hypothetical protein